MTLTMNSLCKIGDRLTIPGYKKFNRRTKTYEETLQVWEVEAVSDTGIKLKPIWN